MKTRLQIMALSLVTLSLFSCEKWLDVKPKQQIEADVLFNREEGFKDALAAIYINMASLQMYGCDMTFGFVDVIGGVYPYTGAYTSSSRYYYPSRWVYDELGGEVDYRTLHQDGVWQKSYNTIANINNLIDNIRKADRNMFAADNYNVLLGEALALRAFIHFDLLRLFAPSYKVNPNATGIPYITKYEYNTTPQYTVSAVLDSVMRDAGDALALLKESDPIYTKREITSIVDDGYLSDRPYRMNYYATTALMSRIHLYRNELSDAARCAQEVIDAQIVRWIPFGDISNASLQNNDRTFSTEQIFVLDVVRLEDYIGRLRLVGNPVNTQLLFTVAYLNTLFPDGDDWRKRFLFMDEGNPGTPMTCIKLGIVGSPPANYRNRVPIIRLPEMYLTLAEAVLETNPSRSIALINELMLNRGIAAGIAPDASVEAIREAILLEYRREFICEGQIFYYHKRLDLPSIIGGGDASLFDKSKYVVPMPMEEIEYGQRKN